MTAIVILASVAYMIHKRSYYLATGFCAGQAYGYVNWWHDPNLGLIHAAAAGLALSLALSTRERRA